MVTEGNLHQSVKARVTLDSSEIKTLMENTSYGIPKEIVRREVFSINKARSRSQKLIALQFKLSQWETIHLKSIFSLVKADMEAIDSHRNE